MNATQLNDYYNRGNAARSSFVPQLSTGTQPPSQASSVAASLPESTVVAKNAVPTPNGLPFTTIQNQNYPVTTDATPPWVSVPACLAGKPKPQSRGMGLTSPSIASLNLPAKAQPITPKQTVHAYTY